VAFALCARAHQETATLNRSLKERVRDFIGRLTEAFEEADGEGDADLTDTLEHLMGEQADKLHKNDELAAQLAEAERDEPNDDPLECQAAAIVASMPPRLVRLAIDDGNINAARVWTTMCCIAFLEDLHFCWLWGDGAFGSAHRIARRCCPFALLCSLQKHVAQVTCTPKRKKRSWMVRCVPFSFACACAVGFAHWSFRCIACASAAAREWLEQYAEVHPSLKEAMADESIQKHAKRLLRLWVRTFEQRVYELRSSPAIVAQRNLSQLHRTGTEMMRALVMRHDTFRTFLSVRPRADAAATCCSVAPRQLMDFVLSQLLVRNRLTACSAGRCL
jgi:hypothetical protein